MTTSATSQNWKKENPAQEGRKRMLAIFNVTELALNTCRNFRFTMFTPSAHKLMTTITCNISDTDLQTK
jgi:hypothetical protein